MRPLLNGVVVDELVAVRGLRYGDGLFETMRADAGQVRLLDWHLARLERGAGRLGIAFDAAAINEDISAALRDTADGVLRFSLIRGGSRRGYQAQPQEPPSRLLEAFAGLPQWGGKVARAMLCETRLSNQPALAGLKHLNRLDQVLAAQEAPAMGQGAGLMLDQDGNLTCALDSNIFIQHSNQLITPAITQAGVAGVFRQWLLDELAPQLGISIKQQNVSPLELASADALWLTNAVRGARWVAEVEARPMAEPSPDSPMARIQTLATKLMSVA